MLAIQTLLGLLALTSSSAHAKRARSRDVLLPTATPRTPSNASIEYEYRAALGLGLVLPTAAPRARSHAVDKRAVRWDYVGCTTDGASRALSYMVDIGNATPERCQAVCEARGNTYAGLQWRTNCFCGNTLDNGQGTVVAESQCDLACPGDASESCGGAYRSNLYRATTVPDTAGFLGCYTDNGDSRTLPNLRTYSSVMTPARCFETCGSAGFALAGLEAGGECYCGNTIDGTRRTTADQCSIPCPGPGASGQQCGGNWRLSVTRLPACGGSVQTGCVGPRNPTTTAPPSSSSSSSAAPTASASAQSLSRVGCYEDSTARMLNGASTTTATNTPNSCMAYCQGRGFIYSGVQNGDQCYCGNSIDYSRLRADNQCSTRCAGNGALTCGGGWRLEIFSQRAAMRVGTPAVPSSGRKWLWAHHMVGNTYSYNQSIWANDIALATDAGIDGFALNMGRDTWQPNRVSLAYAAARAAGGSSFKLFFSFDMTSLPCGSVADRDKLVDLVTTYAQHPAQATYNDRTLVGVWDGAYCTFGQGSPRAAWTSFRSALTARNIPIYLVPSIFTGVDSFAGDQNWFDAHLSWDNSWPLGGEDLDGSRDVAEVARLRAMGKGYMAGISPAFFTYYAPSGWNKNWIYRSDNWLLATRFEQLVQQRTLYDMSELITWNDYGESHYVGPIRADQPMSQGWTNGMPHTAWLGLIKYYSPAYRTGAYPTPVDAMYVWTRPHPKNGNPTNVSPGLSRPRNADYTDDNLYAIFILAAPAQVTLYSGSNRLTVVNLPAGLTKLSVANAAGAIGGEIRRNGAAVKSYDSTGQFSWSTTFRDWNFNYFVGRSAV